MCADKLVIRVWKVSYKELLKSPNIKSEYWLQLFKKTNVKTDFYEENDTGLIDIL